MVGFWTTSRCSANHAGGPKGRYNGSMTRKEQRKAARQQPKNHGREQYEVESEEEEEEEAPPPPPKLSKKAQGKRKAESDDMDEPKRKRKLPELTLPGAKEDDVEDQEIEWLEWMLKKEKEKGKAY